MRFLDKIFRRAPARHNDRVAYEIVTPAGNRRAFAPERKNEDDILGAHPRNSLVNAGRDLMRNSPTRVIMDQQLRVNVAGVVGGKLYAAFPEGFSAAADAVMRYFNRVWAPSCEFTFGKSFNWLLKTVLTAQDVGGNVILVFDDGLLTGGRGTGRIRGFEADEIADVQDEDFARLFPAAYSQRGGFVYDPLGRFTGAFVSTTQRGADKFDSGKYIVLRRDPVATSPANWTTLGAMSRFNQGRSVSPITAGLATAVDLHEILSSETLAAKFNAQLVGQIIHQISEDGDSYNPYKIDTTGKTDADAERVKRVTLDHLRNIGIRYQDMPEGVKMELLDTKRPNANMPQFVDFLTGLVGGTRGLARVYSTLKAQTSYTAFRGEQVMSWPSFEEAQKDLERDVCDWAARLAISRALKTGEISETLPEGWEYMLAWQWPKMREVSERDAQSALKLKLENGITSLKRELGPGEVERIIAERKREKELFDNAGLIYPGTVTTSGEVVSIDGDPNGEPHKGDT